MASLELVLLILRLVGVALGGGFLYFTLQAYRRHRTRSMLILMIAVALWMAAIAVEGFALQGLGLSIDQAHVIESIVMIIASALLLLSVVSHKIKEWQ